jgi:hypothetical protein
MSYNNIQPNTATICLVHLINTVESSDNVSQLLNIEFTNYRCLVFKGMQFFILLMIRSYLFYLQSNITVNSSPLCTSIQILIA